MTVETVTYITDLNSSNPAGTDAKEEGDDHIRNIKTGLDGSFPNFAGIAMTATEAELNNLDGYTGNGDDLNVLAGAFAAGTTNAKILDLANRKDTVKDWGTVSIATQIDLDDAEFHIVEVGANLTMTFASALTNDRATVAIHNNGSYTITPAGIDNNSPTLTVGTNVQDIVGLIKSHGKITLVGLMDNVSAV